jgi:gamma-glutamylputrescine oxidase
MSSSSLLHSNDRPGVYPLSYYAETVEARAKELPKLEGEISADVCVIGGGYTGLSAALHLAQRGYSVVLLEAHRVGWGASGRNGGHLGSGQRMDVLELEQAFDPATARQLWELGEAAKKTVKDLISKHRIDCDLTPGIIHADHRRRFSAHSRRLAERLNTHYSYPHITYLDQAAVKEAVASDDYVSGTRDMDAAHLDPLKYAWGLARAAIDAGVRIFERSEVLSTAPVVTRAGTVKAGTTVLATNGYLCGLDPKISARVMPINNYILTTEPLDADLIPGKEAVADSRFVVNYFRMTPDNRLLFGGGESYGYRFPKHIKRLPEQPMLKIFPQLKGTRIDYAWGGTLAITRSRLPCFVRRDGLYSASGFSGHGVPIATFAGKLIAEAVAGDSERFDIMAKIPNAEFPGGSMLRAPLLALAMTWYALLDRL